VKSSSIRRRRCGAGGVLLCCLLAAQLCAQVHAQVAPPPPGESIYRRGILPSGKPLTGLREPDLKIAGSDAACTNCHRRSGLGEIEGRFAIPPISGIYLFHPKAKTGESYDLPYVDTMRPDRDPYTDATLARAIREGIGVDGRPLNYLMPHYTIDDADLAALTEYLKGMTPSKVPGVTKSVLHFATIITPDADPTKRAGMLDVLQHFFDDKNAFARAESPRLNSSHRMMFKANRRWALHVWELNGPPNTWEEQLRRRLAKEPVFVAISGLGGKNWAPVHHFCEQAALPCLFPNIEVPVVAEHDFYSLYFSKGVLLEGELMSRWLTDDKGAGAGGRTVQIYRTDDVGEAAAKALRSKMAARGAALVDRPVGAGAAEQPLLAALRDLGPHDRLVLWLRPTDIAALGKAPVAGTVLMSGLMGGLGDAPLPAEWRPATRMTYPFDTPDQRRIRMNYPLGWFRIRQIPVVAEQVQTDTFLACSLVAETVNHMADSFIRDFLVERVEGMLEHRIITGYYPRLALAPNQRFASKGGYLVHFADPSGTHIETDGDWLVP
jgi:hypothetical protein